MYLKKNKKKIIIKNKKIYKTNKMKKKYKFTITGLSLETAARISESWRIASVSIEVPLV